MTTERPRQTSESRFSVIIAAYNPGRRILPTIKSVFLQTYRNYELIVVGDGCNDDTGLILQEEYGDRVKWINLDKNYGTQAFANNKGIRQASGTHIAYLGHDDIWAPNHLAS